MLDKSTVLNRRFLYYPLCDAIFSSSTSPIFPVIFGLQQQVL